jgi:hypothetical protein
MNIYGVLTNEAIQNTVLIAQFMGYEVIPYQHNQYNPIYNGNKFAQTVGQQKDLWNGLDLQFTGRFTQVVNYPFDTDFNYLLPIIRRIEESGYVVAICGISYKIYRLFEEDEPIVSLVCGDLRQKTHMTYCLLIDFLKTINKVPQVEEVANPFYLSTQEKEIV